METIGRASRVVSGPTDFGIQTILMSCFIAFLDLRPLFVECPGGLSRKRMCSEAPASFRECRTDASSSIWEIHTRCVKNAASSGGIPHEA